MFAGIMNERLELLKTIKAEWVRSNADRRHPFRLFSLGTIKYPEGTPAIRTVVLRSFRHDTDSFLVFTDSRSPKCLDISHQDAVELLFYHPRKKWQVRVKATAKVQGKEHPDYRGFLEQAKQSPSISDYMTLHPPGTPSEQVEFGDEIHFAFIEMEAKEYDILMLDRAGHKRERFVKTGGDIWEGSSLVP